MKMLINRIHKAGKILTLISAAALALTSCIQLAEDQNGAYGYLTIDGFDVDVQVEHLVPTKGDETVDISKVTGYSAPSLGSVTVTSTTDQSKTYTWSGQDLKLPVGEYKLTTTSGTNGFNTPYFSGSGTVTVTALERVTGTVSFTLGNSVMKVTMAEGFNNHFTPDEGTPVTISNTSGSVSVAMDAYVFVPADKQLTVKIDGKSSAGVEKDFTVTLTPKANTAYNITLSATGITLPSITLPEQQNGAWGGRLYVNPVTSVDGISSENLSKIVYKVYSDEKCTSLVGSSSQEVLVVDGLVNNTKYYVRAEVGNLLSDTKEITVVSPTVTTSHYNDDSGNLAGTTATLDLKLNDFLTDKIEVGDITLVMDDKTMRTAPDSGQATMTVANNYPYLPQGTDYVLNVNHKLKTESEYKSFSMTDIKVGAPEFTVTTRPVSSYTYYEDNKINEANRSDGIGGSAIWIETKIGISENLINNSNYSLNLSGDFSTNTGKSGSITGSGINSNIHIHKDDNLKSLDWREHKVSISCSVTFDNITVEDQKTEQACHVTGLPYSISFYDRTSAPNGWSIGGKVEWQGYGWNDGDSNKYLRLRGDSTYSNRGYALSPKFYIPNDNIISKSTLNCFYYHSTVGKNEDIFVNANSIDHPELSTNKTTLTTQAYFYDDAKKTDVVNEINLSSGTPYVSITHGIDSVDKGPLFNSTYFFGLSAFKLEYK